MERRPIKIHRFFRFPRAYEVRWGQLPPLCRCDTSQRSRTLDIKHIPPHLKASAGAELFRNRSSTQCGIACAPRTSGGSLKPKVKKKNRGKKKKSDTCACNRKCRCICEKFSFFQTDANETKPTVVKQVSKMFRAESKVTGTCPCQNPCDATECVKRADSFTEQMNDLRRRITELEVSGGITPKKSEGSFKKKFASSCCSRKKGGADEGSDVSVNDTPKQSARKWPWMDKTTTPDPSAEIVSIFQRPEWTSSSSILSEQRGGQEATKSKKCWLSQKLLKFCPFCRK